MRGFRRRIVLTTIAGGLFAGCVGDRLDHDDDVPHPLDNADDKNGAIDTAAIESFVESSSATLSHGKDVFETWLDSPDETDLQTIDELRSASTSLLNRFDSDIWPYRDAISDHEPGDEMDGEEWPADGGALMEALSAHETLILEIEEATIGILDADGSREVTDANAIEAAELVVEEAAGVIADAESALHPP